MGMWALVIEIRRYSVHAGICILKGGLLLGAAEIHHVGNHACHTNVESS